MCGWRSVYRTSWESKWGNMIKNKFAELKASAPIALTKVTDSLFPGVSKSHGIRFGVGAAETTGEALRDLGAKGTVFLVSDDVLQELGVVDFVVDVIERSGLKVASFCHVEPEPHVETVQKVLDGIITSKASAVVGLGGGSVMDVAKAAALALSNDVDADTYIMNPTARGKQRRIPLVLMATTSGTGSEVSQYAVATKGQDKQPMIGADLLADLAILDPLLTSTMPKSVTNATGLDALTHAAESLVHKNATPYSDGLAIGAISLIGGALRKASENPDDIVARSNMLTASALAMLSFNQTGGLWAHSVSYIIPQYKPVTHGLGCALGLPYLMSFNDEVVTEKHALISNLLGRSGDSAALVVRDLMGDLGMPTNLREFGGLDENMISEYAALTVEKYPRPGNPREMSEAACRDYWGAMFSGAL